MVPVTPIEAGRPAALAHALTMVTDMLSQFEQDGKRGLGNRSGAVSRNMGHGNVSSAGGGKIDDIGSCRQDADVLKVGKMLQVLACKLGFVGQNHFGRSGALPDLGSSGAVINLARAQGLEVIPTQIARVQSIAIKDNDVHSRFEWCRAFDLNTSGFR